MCPPKKTGSTGSSYTTRSAWNTAALGGALDIGTTLLGTFTNRGKISRQNQDIIDTHNDAIFKYHTQANNDIIAFYSEGQDEAAEADALHVQANKAIAKNQLVAWNAMAEADNEAMESYAQMMSIGHSGQGGRRAGNTDKRKAILAHGAKMAKLGASLSGKLAESTLASESTLDQAKRKNFANQVQHNAGRPIPGTPPTLHESEFIEQDSWGHLALGIGSNLLDAHKTFQSLKPKNAKA